MAFGIVQQVIATCNIPGQYAVKLLEMHDHSYRCEYGSDVRLAMTLDVGMEKFNESVRHAMTCAGLLDDGE
jgi:hypothetical protein